jgi:hypothetical protein
LKSSFKYGFALGKSRLGGCDQALDAERLNIQKNASAGGVVNYAGSVTYSMADSKTGSSGTRVGSRLGLMDFKPQTLGALEVSQNLGLG